MTELVRTTSPENQVWKYELTLEDVQQLSMPIGAQVLSVGEQHGKAVLWALVDPYAYKELRTFLIAGTGHPIEQSGNYIGRIDIANGSLIFHVFEVTVSYACKT